MLYATNNRTAATMPPKIMPVIGLMAPLRSGPLRAGSIEPGNAMSVMGLLVAQSPTLRTVCDSPMKALRRSPPARAEQSGDGSDNEDQRDERKPDQKRTEQQQAAGRDEHGDHQQQQYAAERADARDIDAMRPARLDV